MRTCEAATIYQYLRIVSSLSKGGLRLWYRGVASLDYELVPSLYWRKQAEWERNFVHKFLVRYKAYVETQTTNPWELYALMQHYGVPTRLLDWTRSPLNALYFALTQEPHLNTDRVVWVLPPHHFNKLTIGVDSVFCPASLSSRSIKLKGRKQMNLDAYLPQALDPSDNYKLPLRPVAIETPLSHPRITGQQGCFTLHGYSKKGIGHYFTDRTKAPFLGGIVLKTKGSLNAFLEPLLSWGVNEETIFQDLDSLAKNINREEGIS
jgi:hypothetical protein